ncbi:2,5-diamino-6-(ribosylamino)-4(3H)-pyrimidinone 5'-phosphate reductase [Natronomonas sp. EA1]|uniref:2,5-diamino-6-(ribosylamino)-4(3H)-pyrimidinone 5'-phosphate reductase n=1 Tax=Natronomonas sp. EA1 TaxID=3421655 RepID=UPI003EB7DD6E
MYVHVNAAMSADGKLSTRRREQVTISGDEDFRRVDHIRGRSDGIMVGVGTVLADDPSLRRHDESAREDARRNHAVRDGPPARVVVDSRARTPVDAEILQGEADTFVLVSEAAVAEDVDALRDAGAAVVVAGTDRVALPKALAALERGGIEYLMVEGGGELIFSLFEAGLVDRCTVYVGALILGGRDAPTLADGKGFVDEFPELTLDDVTRVDDGVVLTWSVASERAP